MFGRWDAEAFLDEIDAEQFDQWKAFAEIEPFGPWADDLRNAMGLAQRAARYSKQPVKHSDFMLCKTAKVAPKKRLPLKVLREQMEAALGKPNGKH